MAILIVINIWLIYKCIKSFIEKTSLIAFMVMNDYKEPTPEELDKCRQFVLSHLFSRSDQNKYY